MSTVLAAGLDGPARFITWGPIQISLPNLIVIVAMLVVFVLALVLPFPHDRRRP